MTALSTLLPGAGLLGTRRRNFGRLLLLSFLLIGALVLFYAWRKGFVTAALDLAVRPRVLIGILVAVIAGALLWVTGILLTARETAPNGRGSALRAAFAAFCCLVILAPAATAVRYLTIQHDVVQVLTGGGEDAEANAWADKPRVNVLLLGSDAADDRVGVRTDSMMVASIDTQSGDAVLFSLPRNLEHAPIPSDNPLSRLYPNGYDCGDECLLNGIWTLAADQAEADPTLFPGDDNPGLTTTRDVIGEILGLEIDRSLVVNLRGFQALVNAMGGIDINVKERICVGCKLSSGGRIIFNNGVERWIEPGQQHLDGYHALWYARSRAGSDDFSRMRRQRCVTGAILNQADPIALLRNYPSLAEVIKDNVTLDIPTSELPAWAELVGTLQEKGSVRSLPITNKVVNVVDPDYDQIRELVQNAISPQPTTSAAPTTSAPEPSDTPSESGASPSPSEPTDEVEDISTAC
ncbi:transcriptional regulator [Knoellia sinensis KCTC 19936]|uniref:Transcriptional regulator n=1 Tax=Knoellia sinensis KCTC 19936 TaxID=1385520 RepID=A0A0A0JAL5_9MICO|nr:transcriptional regulator [Knoellia sinensis KCTC 19936]